MFSQAEMSSCSSTEIQQTHLVKLNSHPAFGVPILRSSGSLVRQSSSNSQSRSVSTSSGFTGDRFIPFRGNSDQYIQEFILNNEDPFSKVSRRTAPQAHPPDVEMRLTQTPDGLLS